MTHRSTVLIVTPEQTRSVEVNTRLLLSMRPLLMGLGAVIVALLGALAAGVTRITASAPGFAPVTSAPIVVQP